jgi:polar amino acid transport system substrate-binding protein/glutamate/aspartate transport system substrate-binding protein
MKSPPGNRYALVRFAIVLLAAALIWPNLAVAATLDRIRESQSLRIAYREDAAPFSYKSAEGQPAGLIVELCQMVAQRLAKQLRLAEIKLVFMPVTAAERFEAISQARADILCEATSVTLARREVVDFSLLTFVDGASLMIRTGGPVDLKAMAGRKIGVLSGTTTEIALRNTLRRESVEAEVVLMDTHRAGIAQLDDDKIVAYFADRAILAHLVPSSRTPERLQIAEQYLTVEPYALALPRGDNEFRLAVDRALANIYRTGEIFGLLRKVFGPDVRPSDILQSLYIITGFPD